MALPRRLWCSSVVLAYLSGSDLVRPDCDLIIQQAQRGELEIAVSILAEAEVAYLEGASAEESEARIQEFFSRAYVIPIALDRPLAAVTRRIVRARRGIRAADAVHLATCELWKIPVLETTDGDLLRLDGRVGNPPIRIQRPRFQGTPGMFQRDGNRS